MKKYILGTLAFGIIAGLPATGVAQTPKATMRAHLDTMFLGYYFENAEYKEPDALDGDEVKSGTFSIGIGKPQAGVGFGYALLDNLFLGGRLTMYLDAYENDDADRKTNTFNWGVIPYVEYIFLTRAPARSGLSSWVSWDFGERGPASNTGMPMTTAPSGAS